MVRRKKFLSEFTLKKYQFFGDLRKFFIYLVFEPIISWFIFKNFSIWHWIVKLFRKLYLWKKITRRRKLARSIFRTNFLFAVKKVWDLIADFLVVVFWEVNLRFLITLGVALEPLSFWGIAILTIVNRVNSIGSY